MKRVLRLLMVLSTGLVGFNLVDSCERGSAFGVLLSVSLACLTMQGFMFLGLWDMDDTIVALRRELASQRQPDETGDEEPDFIPWEERNE